MRIALHHACPAHPSTGAMLGAIVLLGTLGACDKDGDSASPSAQPVATPAPLPASGALSATAAPAASEAETQPASAGGSSEHDAIVKCCNALKAAAEQPGESQSKYTVAAAVCSGIARQVKKGGADPSSARVLIRAQLQGLSVPAGC